jgi:hypothetical protein
VVGDVPYSVDLLETNSKDSVTLTSVSCTSVRWSDGPVVEALNIVWNITYHARWTPLQPDDPDYFNKENDCVITGGDYRQDACCGAYGSSTVDVAGISNTGTGTYPLKPYSRRPYATENPGNGCCQDAAIYSLDTQECCIDSGVVTIAVKNACTGTVADPDEIGDFGYGKK